MIDTILWAVRSMKPFSMRASYFLWGGLLVAGDTSNEYMAVTAAISALYVLTVVVDDED